MAFYANSTGYGSAYVDNVLVHRPILIEVWGLCASTGPTPVSLGPGVRSSGSDDRGLGALRVRAGQQRRRIEFLTM
ncbi:hypothetical protein [Kitasatospora paranensis]|uniref:Uncharacterized protein n=1 Tax=Kitasatospora paranensis TaxID=258053 RepID=A0ABW2G5C2_9ACTN